MILFRNVCICAIKILIGKNSIIVWHNQMKIGRYGIFKKKITKEKDITSHVPKFVNVHHVVVKTFQGSQFLRCDCYLYERWVPCCTWIHLLDEFIHTWIHLSHEFINKWIHLLILSRVRWIQVYEESRSTYLPTY